MDDHPSVRQIHVNGIVLTNMCCGIEIIKQ